jgi:hypothetical protein
MSLEGRYRRLLLAYPRSYREHRGEEIVATLMEDARPGQTRPDRRARLDLALGGLRERLGLHEPDGFAAGTALVSPVCLALAVGYAVYFPVLGFHEPAAVAAALIWVCALAVWSVAPQWSVPALAIAFAVTCVTPVVGQLGMLLVVAPWGLAALLGELPGAGRVGERSPLARLVAPVLAAVLTVLVVWPTAFMFVQQDPVYIPIPPLWSFLLKDVLVLVAVVVGVGLAAWRRSGRLAWAAFTFLAAWSLSVSSDIVYEFEFSGLYVSDLLNRPAVFAGLAVLTIGLAVIAARRGGAGIPTLQRAGSLAVGFVGGTAALVLVVLFAGGARPGMPPAEVVAWGLLIVPALTDRWVPAAVQRSVLILMGGAFAAIQFGGDGIVLGRAELLLLLLLGAATRGAGRPTIGGVVGLGIGVLVGAVGLLFVGPIRTVFDPASLGWTDSVVTVLVAAVAVGAAVVFNASEVESWLGPTAFTVGALWIALPNGTVAAALVIVAGIGMLALAIARLIQRVRDQGGGPSSVIELS